MQDMIVSFRQFLKKRKLELSVDKSKFLTGKEKIRKRNGNEEEN